MNILGMNVQRAKTLNATMAALAKPVEDDDPTLSESGKFAKRWHRGTAAEMLTTLEMNRKAAERNSKIALYISIPHQMTFLLGMVTLRFDTLIGALGSICLLGLSIGLPYLGDQAILMCIRVIATRAVSTWDKVKASLVLMLVIPASATLNFIAPGPQLLKLCSAGVVALVPLYQIVRTCRPSFRKVGDSETQMNAEVAALHTIGANPATSTRTPQAELNRRRSAAERFAKANPNATIAQVMRVSGASRNIAKRVLAELNGLPAVAPTSPGKVPLTELNAGMAGAR